MYARRNGTAWFLAVISSTKARILRVPLSFLGNGGYTATMVSDDVNDSGAVKMENKTLNHGDTLSIELRDGGFVTRFTKN